MSAIIGLYNLNHDIIPEEYGATMMRAYEKIPFDIAHMWQKGNVIFGCYNQWLTVESQNTILPFYDTDRRLVITGDVILDNREELFQQLEIPPRMKALMTDSELILRAYHKWEEDTPKYLLGEFAFIIWDEKRQQLFAARDFSGCRTLYFYKNHDYIIFSTLIHPLFSLPFIPRKRNENWIAEFLAIPEMIHTVDIKLSPYLGIEQVPPSHSVVIKDGKIITSRYLVIEKGETLKLSSNGEYEEAFREVFQKAVNSAIRTHRPVGSQLSGGLDSGAVASFASRTLQKEGKPLFTYSSIPEKSFIDWTPHYSLADERPLIEKTITFSNNMTPKFLNFDNEDPYSKIDDLINIVESPYKFFENSVWLDGIYQAAKEDKIGVLLSGARGNMTISWGPALDYYAVLLKNLNVLKLFMESMKYSRFNGVKHSRVLKVVRNKAYPKLNNSDFPQLISPAFAKQVRVFEKLKDCEVDIESDGGLNIYKRRINHFNQLFHWLTSASTAGKFSIKYNVWKRDPTNDLRVIKYCLSVPENQYVQQGWGRSLIRRATKDYLPVDVRLNQKTRGIQGSDWVHRMAYLWDSFLHDSSQLLKDSDVSCYFNKEVLTTALNKVKNGPKAELAFDPDFRILMRGLILTRFIKRFT